MSVFIGIDNGVSGSIGIITDGGPCFIPTPVFKQQNYTKIKKNISRVNYLQLKRELKGYGKPRMVMLERPMVNPGRFLATASALRALEVTLVALEVLEFPYTFVDSKEWQSYLLPKGTKGPAELKKASMDIGCRLWPMLKTAIIKQHDADGLFLAEHARRVYG